MYDYTETPGERFRRLMESKGGSRAMMPAGALRDGLLTNDVHRLC